MLLCWTDDAWADYLYWQSQDRRTLKRVNTLIRDMQRTPFEGIGKPEPLKWGLSGAWSRRIDSANRIIYTVADDSSASSPRRTTTELRGTELLAPFCQRLRPTWFLPSGFVGSS